MCLFLPFHVVIQLASRLDLVYRGCLIMSLGLCWDVPPIWVNKPMLVPGRDGSHGICAEASATWLWMGCFRPFFPARVLNGWMAGNLLYFRTI